MLIKNKKIVLVLVLKFLVAEINAQALYSPTIPSPNAASLGQYGDLPVSYFTGVPNISVPLYEVQGNKIGLPISLSYHAVGLRPDVHPGWVGNGWSLNAGGVITRKMNQMMDEFQYIFDVNGNGQYYMRMSDWASDAKVKTNNFYASLFPLDVEPDEFDFNFLGYSGKFFLNQNGVWQVQCDKSIKVLFDFADLVTPFLNTIPSYGIVNSGIIKTFGKFTLIDESGTKYIFGSTDVNNTAVEYSGAMIVPTNQRGVNNFFATSWYLSQIISSDGSETINLNYERGPFTSQMTYNSVSYQMTSGCGTSGPHSDGISGSVVSPVYLKSISMPARNLLINFNKSKSFELKYMTGSSTFDAYVRIYQDAGFSSQDISLSVNVDFPSFYTLITSPSIIPYYSSNTAPEDLWERFIWLKLDQINVINSASNSPIENISFSYTENASKRLSLKRVSIDDKKYTFYYNPLSLPNYITIFGDHWGFNNQGNTSGNQIPVFTSQGQGWPSTQIYAVREPVATGVPTQAEILTDIFYPTGGKVHLDYEPNTYSTVVKREIGTTATAENGIAGGLRIKQITKTNNFGTTGQKNFYYVNNYTAGSNPSLLPSSGVLDTKPSYHFVKAGIGNKGGVNISFSIDQYQSSSVIPLTSNSMSNHIGYSTVVEKRSDGGYSIYKFTNHETSSSPYNDIPAVNSYNSGFFNGYLISSSNYFKRGKLLQKTDYTASGNKVLEIINTYANVLPEILTNAVHQYGTTVCEPSGGAYGVNAFAKTAYNIISTPFLPTSTIKKEYTSDYSGNSISQTSTFTYDQYKNVLSETSTNSKGQEVLTTYRYPYHFTSPANVMNPYNIMVSNNMVGKVIEKIVTVAGKVVNAEIYTYRARNSTKVYNDAIYKAELKDPVNLMSFVSTTSNDAGDLAFDPRLKKVADLGYDGSNNLSSVLKPGDESASYIWDYNSQFPSAQVVNAKNVYAVASTSGPIIQVSKNVFVSNTKYISYPNSIYISATGATGVINLSFAYSNYYISGNNTSTLAYSVTGITDPSFYRGGSLCAATMSATCSSGSSTAAITSVPTGQYTVSVTLVSVNGFNNYYGYNCNISYPTSYQTPAVTANNEIAYTSFEYANSGELNYGTGNFSGIAVGNIATGTSVTGNKFYFLSGSTITKSGLDPAKTYLVTYWSNTAALAVSGSQTVTQNASLNFGNWKYYEHKITGVSSIAITGSAGIDELRVYPNGAQMVTYTYTPLVGMTSQCDINNVVSYYEYDSFSRLKTIRDKDRNIIKLFDYKY